MDKKLYLIIGRIASGFHPSNDMVIVSQGSEFDRIGCDIMIRTRALKCKMQKLRLNKGRYLNIDGIKNACKGIFDRHEEVCFAYLFGSYTRNEVSGISDIDIAVYLKEEKKGIFLQLYIELCRALGTDRIDLLIINKVRNLLLLDTITREGIILYDRESSRRDAFEIRIQHLALDFRNQRKVVIGV